MNLEELTALSEGSTTGGEAPVTHGDITAPIEPAPEEPVVTEAVATEPVATEPVATEPVATEPVVTEPVAPSETPSLESLQKTSDITLIKNAPASAEKKMEESDALAKERFLHSKNRRHAAKVQADNERDAFFERRLKRNVRQGVFSLLESLADTIDFITTKPAAAALNSPGIFGFEQEEEDKFQSGGIKMLLKEVLKSDMFFESTPLPEDLPNTPYTAAGRAVGETLAMFLVTPFGAELKTAVAALPGGNLSAIKQGLMSFDIGKFTAGVQGLSAKAANTGKGMAKDLGESIRDNPVLTTAGEISGATAAGATGFAVQERFPDSPVWKFTGEVIAGTIATATVLRVGLKTGKSLVGYFKDEVVNDDTLVQKRLQRDLDDSGSEGKDTVLSKLKEGEQLERLKGIATPAQTSGSHLLARIHQALIAQTDKLTYTQQAQFDDFNHALLESAKDSTASPQKIQYTKDFLRDQQQAMVDAMDQLLENAKEITRKTIKDFEDRGIKLTLDDANRIAQEQLEFIRKAAREQETQLYDAIPDLTKFSMEAPHEALQRELARRSQTSNPADLPEYVTHFLGKVVKLTKKQAEKLGTTHAFKPGSLKKTATAKDLRNLRGRLMDDAREAAANGNGEKATLLNNIAEGIRQTISDIPAGADPQTVHTILAAHHFSNKFNDVFTRGHIAPLLKRVKEGGTKLQDDDFLDVGVKGAGRKKAKTLKALIQKPKNLIDEEGIPLGPNADPNQLIGAVEDWVKGDFIRRFVEDNHFKSSFDSVAAARRYLDANKETFDLFPSIREDILKMIETGDAVSVMQRRVQDLGTELGNPNISKATMFIQQKTAKAFDSIKNLDDANVDLEIQSLLAKVNEDTSGEALEGLQAAMFDWIIKRGQEKTATIGRKELFLDGTLLTRAINDPATKVMAFRVLSKDQLERLELIRDAAERLSISRDAQASVEGITGDKLGSNLSTLVSIVGAQAGRKIAGITGGGTVQTPSLMARRLRQLAEAGVVNPVQYILNETFLSKDRQHLINLLKELKTPEEVKKTQLSLGIWLGTAIARLGGSYIPEEEQ